MSSGDTVLEAAADYMEDHGWTRGQFERRGRVCLRGAISLVPRGGISVSGAITKLERYLHLNYMQDHIPSQGDIIVNFNDDRCKSKKQAVRILREAASWEECAQ